MSSRVSSAQNADTASRASGGAKYPDCPKCNRRMTVKQVTPVLFTQDVDDVVYGCDECGTEVKRSIRRG